MTERLQQLKANAYDTLVRIDQLQRILAQINQQIKDESANKVKEVRNENDDNDVQ